MGYRLNRLDEPVFITVSKIVLTEIGIHYRFESCEGRKNEIKNKLKQMSVQRPEVQGRGSDHRSPRLRRSRRLRPCDGRRLSLEGCRCAAGWRGEEGGPGRGLGVGSDPGTRPEPRSPATSVGGSR